ncbi:MAG: hypothetical protein KF757_14335 [Phycisphaeraceae bacterium]|nr:hypothetical protein [Phycisphaeraceae bacterium]MCW5762927.1 hypothetical protein [Phycisphaeraceae bacterium]
MHYRRHLRRLFWCLMAGLVATWLSAWGLAAMASSSPHGWSEQSRIHAFPVSGPVLIRQRERLGAVQRSFHWNAAARLSHEEFQNYLDLAPSTEVGSTWGISGEDLWTISLSLWHPGTTQESAWGWPKKALWYVWDEQGGMPNFIGGVRLPKTFARLSNTGVEYPGALPFIPIWSGVLLNTLFFACLFAGIGYLALLVKSESRAKFRRLAAKYLTLGAFTTVVSAWVFAATSGLLLPSRFVQSISVPITNSSSNAIAVQHHLLWGGQVRSMEENQRYSRLSFGLNSFTTGVLNEFQEPQWGLNQPELSRAFSDEGVFQMQERAWGWPMLAMHCRWENNNPGEQFIGGVPLPEVLALPSHITGTGQNPAIPYLPIWRGLFINTLFFAIAWFLLMIMFAGFRQRRRMLRGQCPHCAHDLRGRLGDGCAECGWRKVS